MADCVGTRAFRSVRAAFEHRHRAKGRPRAVALPRAVHGIAVAVDNGETGRAAGIGDDVVLRLQPAQVYLETQLKFIGDRIGIDDDVEPVVHIDAKAERQVPAELEVKPAGKRQRQRRLKRRKVEAQVGACIQQHRAQANLELDAVRAVAAHVGELVSVLVDKVQRDVVRAVGREHPGHAADAVILQQQVDSGRAEEVVHRVPGDLQYRLALPAHLMLEVQQPTAAPREHALDRRTQHVADYRQVQIVQPSEARLDGAQEDVQPVQQDGWVAQQIEERRLADAAVGVLHVGRVDLDHTAGPQFRDRLLKGVDLIGFPLRQLAFLVGRRRVDFANLGPRLAKRVGRLIEGVQVQNLDVHQVPARMNLRQPVAKQEHLGRPVRERVDELGRRVERQVDVDRALERRLVLVQIQRVGLDLHWAQVVLAIRQCHGQDGRV